MFEKSVRDSKLDTLGCHLALQIFNLKLSLLNLSVWNPLFEIFSLKLSETLKSFESNEVLAVCNEISGVSEVLMWLNLFGFGEKFAMFLERVIEKFRETHIA